MAVLRPGWFDLYVVPWIGAEELPDTPDYPTVTHPTPPTEYFLMAGEAFKGQFPFDISPEDRDGFFTTTTKSSWSDTWTMRTNSDGYIAVAMRAGTPRRL